MMAETTSPSTGHRYGVARVCRVWEVARSSFYAAREAATVPAERSTRRGPQPAVSDEALLAASRRRPRRCLGPAPTSRARRGPARATARCGPGRLRAMDGIRVSRKRVLRLMRAHALLSPHRARPRPEAAHDRRIVTEAPNIMWATDASQITTVQDGKVWLFGVAEHWNAELLGWHVAKHGTRYEAIQALGMAVRRQFGHLGAGAARGLALRHDHGSNFMSDAFQKQIRFWGVAPSYAFVGEPETNGGIERLFRTLKGLGHCLRTVVHGRIFRTIDDVREAVRAFVARYNAEWLIEKNGHRSPADMRAAWDEQTFRRAA
jgi:putative transposase